MKYLTAALMLLFTLAANAASSSPAVEPAKEATAEAATPAHKVVYQCNRGDEAYYTHLLFSVGQLKAKYGDDVDIVVSCFGPGLHLLGKHPGRKVPADALEKMTYLDTFGVKFHACGNTMKALGWKQEDLHDFVEMVPIGAEDLMLLQEQGYQYLAM